MPTPLHLTPWLARTVAVLVLGAAAPSLSAQFCGPFDDVSGSNPFCEAILEVYYRGITAGTSPTTFGPTLPVTRQQMAAFVARGSDAASAASANRRAALDQFWTTQGPGTLDSTVLGGALHFCKSDGSDMWVVHSDTVSRVRASDGKLLDTWTGASSGDSVRSAMGKIFVAASLDPGALYRIDPRLPAGAVTTVATNLGAFPSEIAFDGARIWTANYGGSVSIITPGGASPWSVTTVSAGFFSPRGILYDGANIWVTDSGGGAIRKLDANGAILQSVLVGATPTHSVFDGTNIWVINYSSNSVTVVRAANGAIVATLSANGLNGPLAGGFDGQRILVTNYDGDSVSLWRASDLAAMGSFATGAGTFPLGACSDGINFFLTFNGTGELARF